jgi:uncharacterized membrane protein YeiH
LDTFNLPLALDLAATFLFALTGAWAAIRRGYDFVGVFALALVTGVGGGLIRDAIFIQQGIPAALQDMRYLQVVLAATVLGALLQPLARRFERLVAAVDALGLGLYAVVGTGKAWLAHISPEGAILVGVINAAGGGVIRDVLTREEPLVFKPGQFYVLAALAGATIFVLLRLEWRLPASDAAWISIAATFLFRMLAIELNWRTAPVSEIGWWRRPVEQKPPADTGE